MILNDKRNANKYRTRQKKDPLVLIEISFTGYEDYSALVVKN